jgi:sulfopyruvate decarboxylase subunit beta
MIPHDDGLKVLSRHVRDEIVIAAYGVGIDWDALMPRPLNFFSTGAMSLSSAHGLGFALGRPDKRVIVLDGDGSLIMGLGSMVTVAEAAPRNLVHIVWENGTYQANGGHPLPGRGRTDFAAMARAAGYRSVHVFDDVANFEQQIGAVLAEEGPVFVDLKIDPGPVKKRDYKYVHGAKLREVFRAAMKS